MQPLLQTSVRTGLRPGDLGRIIELHGRLYSSEHGWSSAFEASVAEGLARWALDGDPATDRIWIAEQGERFAGSIAIVRNADGAAQLRWFLLHPDARGRGLGRRLLDEALAFCRERAFPSVFLWTAASLPAAAHLYRAAGFRLVEERPHTEWGPPVTLQRYRLELGD